MRFDGACVAIIFAIIACGVLAVYSVSPASISINDRGERVFIRPRVERAEIARLFGAHVRGRADREAGVCQRLTAVRRSSPVPSLDPWTARRRNPRGARGRRRRECFPA